MKEDRGQETEVRREESEIGKKDEYRFSPSVS